MSPSSQGCWSQLTAFFIDPYRFITISTFTLTELRWRNTVRLSEIRSCLHSQTVTASMDFKKFYQNMHALVSRRDRLSQFNGLYCVLGFQLQKCYIIIITQMKTKVLKECLFQGGGTQTALCSTEPRGGPRQMGIITWLWRLLWSFYGYGGQWTLTAGCGEERGLRQSLQTGVCWSYPGLELGRVSGRHSDSTPWLSAEAGKRGEEISSTHQHLVAGLGWAGLSVLGWRRRAGAGEICLSWRRLLLLAGTLTSVSGMSWLVSLRAGNRAGAISNRSLCVQLAVEMADSSHLGDSKITAMECDSSRRHETRLQIRISVLRAVTEKEAFMMMVSEQLTHVAGKASKVSSTETDHSSHLC